MEFLTLYKDQVRQDRGSEQLIMSFPSDVLRRYAHGAAEEQAFRSELQAYFANQGFPHIDTSKKEDGSSGDFLQHDTDTGRITVIGRKTPSAESSTESEEQRKFRQERQKQASGGEQDRDQERALDRTADENDPQPDALGQSVAETREGPEDLNRRT